MRALFNGICGKCGQFRSRCATVCLLRNCAKDGVESREVALCELCRRLCRGNYRVHPKHKGKKP